VPVIRRKTTPTPMVTRKTNRMQVPLKSKGAEIHLPALPKFNLGWRLISGAIFLLSLAVVISFAGFANFTVNAVTLEGAQRLESETILKKANITGKSIIRVKPDEVAAAVAESFPSLSSVRVSVALPATVTIRVTERQPVVLWQGEAKSLWIDAEGVMFPVRGEAEVPLTVLAAGNPPAAPQPSTSETENGEDEDLIEEGSPENETKVFPKTTAEFVKGILTLNTYLPESSNLQYDPEFGLGWQDPAGWRVYFGKDINNIEIKLAEYQTILAALKEKNLSPSMISVEFLYAPFYRLE
jgi:cell division protein FtsQ